MFGIGLCFCTCALTYMQALIYRWISGVVGGKKTLYIKIPIKPIHDNEQGVNSMMEWAPGKSSCSWRIMLLEVSDDSQVGLSSTGEDTEM